ncbi:PEP-CTERM sorting domain-containing protein [Planctomycetota bacterium]|nr:PEP-CTERM sorting domain-containing protein [Planctomycetota bacterium]
MRFKSLLFTLPVCTLITGVASAEMATYKVGNADPFTGATYTLDTSNDGGIMSTTTLDRMTSYGGWNGASVGSTTTHDWTPATHSEAGYDHVVQESLRMPLMRFDVSSMIDNYQSISGGTLELTLYDRQAAAPSFAFDVVALKEANAGWKFGDTLLKGWNDVTCGAYKGYIGGEDYKQWASATEDGAKSFYGIQPSDYDALNISQTLVNGEEVNLNRRVFDDEGIESWVPTKNMYSPSDVIDGVNNPQAAMTFVIDLSAELIEEWIADPMNAGFMIVGRDVNVDKNNALPTTTARPAAVGILNDSNLDYRPVLNINYTAIPEPASLALLGLGSLALLRRKH